MNKPTTFALRLSVDFLVFLATKRHRCTRWPFPCADPLPFSSPSLFVVVRLLSMWPLLPQVAAPCVLVGSAFAWHRLGVRWDTSTVLPWQMPWLQSVLPVLSPSSCLASSSFYWRNRRTACIHHILPCP